MPWTSYSETTASFGGADLYTRKLAAEWRTLPNWAFDLSAEDVLAPGLTIQLRETEHDPGAQKLDGKAVRLARSLPCLAQNSSMGPISPRNHKPLALD